MIYYTATHLFTFYKQLFYNLSIIILIIITVKNI